MSSLMLINPRKRRKGRSAAQKAATRRMVAARRSSPKRAAPKRHRNPISTSHLLHRRARRRSNPASRQTGIVGMVAPVLQGAAGALGLNAIYSMLPLPATLKTGQMRHVGRAGVAIALGIVGRRFLGRAGAKMVEGALIVEAAHAMSEMFGKTVPMLKLNGLDDGIPDYSGMGAITEEYTPALQYYTPESQNADVMQGLSEIPDYA